MTHVPDRFSAFYLQEVADNCQKIIDRISKHSMDHASYAASSEYQDMLAMPLLRICEIARSFTSEMIDAYPGYDWAAVAKMRPRITHPYSGFDPEAVWMVATEDIPGLLAHCRRFLQ